LYFIFTATWTPSTTVGYDLGKTIVFCLVTGISSTFLDILIPWIVASYSTT
jgi:hypothetical protein